MSQMDFKNKALTTSQRIGRAGLHAIGPDDFEYYSCSFELVDSNFNVIDLFHFPVMPNSISIGRQSLISIKKTGAGYLAQFSNSFVGQTISINGTFGRKFRVILGGRDLKFKTGYGALKLMEKFIKRSCELENGKPRFLIFNNLSFNQSFIVEVLNFNPTMSLENNMVWNYSLDMKALADVDEIKMSGRNSGRLVALLAIDVANKVINETLKEFDIEDLL